MATSKVLVLAMPSGNTAVLRAKDLVAVEWLGDRAFIYISGVPHSFEVFDLSVKQAISILKGVQHGK